MCLTQDTGLVLSFVELTRHRGTHLPVRGHLRIDYAAVFVGLGCRIVVAWADIRCVDGPR
jgi:hypothetical protein